MRNEQTPEELESVREEYERQTQDQQTQPYVPRPKWHIVLAWVLVCIVVLGIINVCYWQIFG